MVKREMVVAYVDNLLKRLTGNDELKRDSDGDWPFNLKSSVMFVRVTADAEPIVRVWGVGAKDVPASEKLFTLLNGINHDIQFARAFWAKEGTIFIATELVGESIDAEELDTALQRVASGIEFFGHKIIDVCGGNLVNPPQPLEPATEPQARTGGEISATRTAVASEASRQAPTGGYL